MTHDEGEGDVVHEEPQPDIREPFHELIYDVYTPLALRRSEPTRSEVRPPVGCGAKDAIIRVFLDLLDVSFPRSTSNRLTYEDEIKL